MGANTTPAACACAVLCQPDLAHRSPHPPHPGAMQLYQLRLVNCPRMCRPNSEAQGRPGGVGFESVRLLPLEHRRPTPPLMCRPSHGTALQEPLLGPPQLRHPVPHQPRQPEQRPRRTALQLERGARGARCPHHRCLRPEPGGEPGRLGRRRRACGRARAHACTRCCASQSQSGSCQHERKLISPAPTVPRPVLVQSAGRALVPSCPAALSYASRYCSSTDLFMGAPSVSGAFSLQRVPGTADQFYLVARVGGRVDSLERGAGHCRHACS